ncbi:GNAT family N-acetyltransferase [Phyllobacterium sp. K27]
MQNAMRLKSFELVARDIAEVDVSLLHALSLGVGWPHRSTDWEILLQSGHGLVAVDGIGRVFGTAMWFPHGEDFATIGMVITSPRTQAQGNGRWLMDQVFERCAGRSLSLNATHAAHSLYVSLGFLDEATVYQCQGEVALTLPPLPTLEGALVTVSAHELDTIANLDAQAFRINRASLLELIATKATIYGLRRNGQLVGYSFCRDFGRGKVIGPVIATNDHDAIHLTAVHLQSLKGAFARVDTREKDGAYADFLAQSRLDIFGTVTTMSKGRRFLGRKPDEPWVYGLAAHGWS